MISRDYDAVVVGSGPNGLAAAIVLQQAGLSVILMEGKEKIGGGLRSEELTLPGYMHDYCSAIHPLAATSPFFKTLPLEQYGLEYIDPPIPLAHPFDDGTAALLHRSLAETADGFGVDSEAYLKLIAPVVKAWPELGKEVLAPLHFPNDPWDMGAFGWKALSAAMQLSKRFNSEKAKGFWGGLSLHSQLPFSYLTSSAIGMVLLTVGHIRGWPFPKGGAQSLADALAAYFISLGGKIEINQPVRSLDQLPSSRAVLLDVSPRQLLQIAGHGFSSIYKWQLEKYRYGMGVFKMDWALDASIPFTAPEARKAGTLHLGGTLAEIARTEAEAWEGKHPEKPAVILAQQTVFDPGRAPAGKHTAWAYCHVPLGSDLDMTDAIEKQVERFAPGFRELILARHSMNTAALEVHNANYIGGDIGGGANNLSQLFTRPALRSSPYRTSQKGIYICSASTPPAGGVHGMCGYYAAKRALGDIFKIKTDN